MIATPTSYIHKTLGALDPWTPYQPPKGGLYRAASWVRDAPASHPFLTAGLLLSGPLSAPVGAHIWTAAAIYSTATEAIHALPRIARALEQVGRGRPEFTAPRVDTQAAMSMRQASLRAIHDSGFFLKAVLGREARLMHR